MPIKPENRHRYPANWKQIREAILERAKHRCEWCGVTNHSVGRRLPDGTWDRLRGNIYIDAAGFGLSYPSMQRISYSEAREYAFHANEWPEGPPYIVIVLTIAHIHDENPENCEPENLAALCQRCHNKHDAPKRAQRRKEARQSVECSHQPKLFS
jgi:5-methylcytosine-specific restriction endonuclease McrA